MPRFTAFHEFGKMGQITIDIVYDRENCSTFNGETKTTVYKTIYLGSSSGPFLAPCEPRPEFALDLRKAGDLRQYPIWRYLLAKCLPF
jgi:hypothetical protein